MVRAGLAGLRRRLARSSRVAASWRDRLRGIRRIHFLHVGKTGGTALKAALRAVDAPDTRILLHPHRVTLADIPAGEPCFFVVRDPISRYASGFLSRRREGRPRYHFPWRPEEARAFARFERPNDLALALSDPDERRREAAVRAMRSVQHVKDSYWHWLHDEAYLRSRRSDILFVGSRENLEGDWDILCERLGITAALPTDSVAAHRNPLDVREPMDRQAVANLRAWYSADYACLALLREWFPHLPDYGAAGEMPNGSR